MALSRKNHPDLSSTEIMRHLDRDEHTHFIAYLRKGETAWDPTSTKHFIHGPAKVTYTQYIDGAVEVIIESTEIRKGEVE